MKYSILFGAGAEKVFNIPTGPEFAMKSIIMRNDKMMNALKELSDKDYEIVYMFDRRDSISFKICVFKTAKYLLEKYNFEKKELKEELELYIKTNDKQIANMVEDLSNDSINRIRDLFDKIKAYSEEDIQIILNDNHDAKNVEELICKNFIYEGYIEKDFYNLIDKNKYSKRQYYKLFNYFWSSFFSIINPIANVIPKWKKLNNNNYYYNFILNLRDIIKSIYSNDLLDLYENLDIEKNYYAFFSKLKDFEISSILTTNYTPFLQLYFGDNVYYLAGKLNMFEKSEQNIIFTLPYYIENLNIEQKLDFFPFLMTQSPIKPIIHPCQIKEYFNAIESLNNSDCLIIIGYSLCDNDNHILSLIKDYLSNTEKKIIYCDFNINIIENTEEYYKTKKNEVKQKLKLDNTDQIIIVQNKGNTIELFNSIKVNI